MPAKFAAAQAPEWNDEYYRLGGRPSNNKIDMTERTKRWYLLWKQGFDLAVVARAEGVHYKTVRNSVVDKAYVRLLDGKRIAERLASADRATA